MSYSLEGLDLRHLQALRAVTEEGTFGRAAEVLGYTQSAVSQQIAALERVVGEPVFERPGGPRPVRLTPAGRMLLVHAEQILDRVTLMEREFSAFKHGVAGRIDVGVFQSVAVKVLPTLVGRLRRERPDIDVRPFEHYDDRVLLDRVRQGELDVSFVSAPVLDDDVEVIHLFDDPYVAVMPADAASGPVAVEELAGAPLVGNHSTDTCQIRIDAGLRDVGINPDYVFRTNDNAALQSMVRAGMGIAVMPRLAVDFNDRSVCVRPMGDIIAPRSIFIVLGNAAAPAVRRFVELAVEVGSDPSVMAPAAPAGV